MGVAEMKTVIETHHLTKKFHESFFALNDVSITIYEGEFVTVIGRSGSGKSTLLNIVGCLDQPSAGEVALNGSPVNYANAKQLVQLRRHTLGFVFQHFSLISSMTAQENIEYPLLFSGVSRSERRMRALAMLKQVGLADRATHLPGELSGGEQQRVAICRALISNPALILADEPTGNLDSTTSKGIVTLMQEINRDLGTTFLVVTHEASLWQDADRSIRLSDGRVIS
ncbi:ABC transporter ATP-binding protein [Methanocalculus sp. MSAO_Arc2]|uniref:ABC transporter ATP-binding protein n=1 Tax=Methanocalculus sp. MSAO_Arc2 TaxID=2293855 RepID=UPI0032163611